MNFLTALTSLAFAAWIGESAFAGVAPARPSAPFYSAPVPVPEPKGFREWRYLVIHHSGSSVGNVAMLQAEHLRRGMENGLAYHFLIGNGSAGLRDGEVAEGRRWRYQLQGGHTHQPELNEVGIGICLVGNFNRTSPTDAQWRALAQLALRLQREFNIPDDHIHGHGQYFGEDSDCPGKNFAWERLWKAMDAAFERERTPQSDRLASGATPPSRQP
ncbi:MAG: N-acetylmuramoyl-L-alanine amidase [Verrucomicrobiae bacterium]|nr:N-acetylmuramoyl-L-alanine amidase [Verrucomicrobiae bacterium]